LIWRGGIAALLIAGCTAPALADAVVIRSVGPDADRFPIGAMVRKGAAVDLQRGSILSLLDRAGSFELRGEIKTRIGKRPVETATRLQMMQDLIKKRKRIRRMAVVAAADVPPPAAPPAAEPPPPGGPSAEAPRTTTRSSTPPRIDAAWWQYPLGAEGRFCLVPGQPLDLVRLPGPEIDFTLRDDMAGLDFGYRLGSNVAITTLSEDRMPVADGRSYILTIGNARPVMINFMAIPTPRDALSLAQSLAKQGCKAQLDALKMDTLTPR
jgi:hypothetical protein